MSSESLVQDTQRAVENKHEHYRCRCCGNSHRKCIYSTEKSLCPDLLCTDDRQYKTEHNRKDNSHNRKFQCCHQTVKERSICKNIRIVVKSYILCHLTKRCGSGKAQLDRLNERPEYKQYKKDHYRNQIEIRLHCPEKRFFTFHCISPAFHKFTYYRSAASSRYLCPPDSADHVAHYTFC